MYDLSSITTNKNKNRFTDMTESVNHNYYFYSYLQL